MCGICGVMRFDGAPVSPATLRGMTDALAHRGPDAEGMVMLPVAEEPSPVRVGLGQRRLAVIDLSPSGAQPMTNEDESLWIVLNGEIYNFQTLRRRLEARHPFKSQSDTETILHLYEEEGERCVEGLEGMFAFALWDGRRRRLLLARDRAGKKPLYHARAGSAFTFASEPKALLRHPAVSDAIAVESLPHYFALGYAPPGRSFYQAIEQLPPAHTMVIEADGRSTTRRYWRPAFGRSRAGDTPPSFAQACADVRDLVTDAVKKRLVADVPLGAFLSGGIDSSIVVGVMSRLLRRPVKTFTIGVGDASMDETRYARLAAQHFGTDHTEFIVEAKAVGLIEALVHHHDGPFGDSSAIPSYIVAQLTREHVTVALNGDGGDEVFGGYLRFRACLAAEAVPPLVSRLAARALALLPEPSAYHHWRRRLRRFVDAASHPMDHRLRRWVSIFTDDLPLLLRPEVLATGTPGDYPADVQAEAASISGLARLLYLNFTTYLPDDLLVKMDRATMAHGLEARSPFLDHRLVDYVGQLPAGFLVRAATGKRLLRAAFADLLPPAILRRGKRGFGVPLGRWFRHELHDYVGDVLVAPDARARDYVDTRYVARLVAEHQAGARDHSAKLWALLTFETWLRQR